MIAITGANNKKFFLGDDTNAIVLEPREHHDSAIIGYDANKDIFLYSKQLFLDQLMAQDMTYEEAIEWYHHNTLGTYVKNYPVFLDIDPETGKPQIESFESYEQLLNESEWNSGSEQ